MRLARVGVFFGILTCVFGCNSSNELRDASRNAYAGITEEAILGNSEKRRAVALWKLFQSGKEIREAPRGWYHTMQGEGSTKHLMSLKGTRVSRVNDLIFIVYGYVDGKYYLSAVMRRRKSDGKLGVVKLVEHELDEDLTQKIKFDSSSLWREPQPYPSN